MLVLILNNVMNLGLLEIAISFINISVKDFIILKSNGMTLEHFALSIIMIKNVKQHKTFYKKNLTVLKLLFMIFMESVGIRRIIILF